MNTNTSKASQKTLAQKDSLLEQLRDLGGQVPKTLAKDVVGGVASDALSSLFGTPKSRDLQPGQEVNLGTKVPSPEEKTPSPPLRRERPVVNHYKETINRLRAQETEVAKKIEEIRLELKGLIAAIKQVDKEIQNTVEQDLVDPSVYHLTFLHRLKTILVLMRKNLVESASWLAVMRSKKKQRTYWSLYKKKGTEFGLNHERVVATQVG